MTKSTLRRNVARFTATAGTLAAVWYTAAAPIFFGYGLKR